MIAVGNLDKIWFAIPEDVAAKELQEAFHSYFGAEWNEVLDVTDKSHAYNTANNAYFSVCNLCSTENLTLEQLVETEGIEKPLNIIVS